MRYKSFEIIRYKAINKKLLIKFNYKNKIIPIIGINECGKTTILKSILAFDYCNDKQNNSEHIKEVVNLYMPNLQDTEKPAEIKATISLEDLNDRQKSTKNIKKKTKPEKDDKEKLKNIIKECYDKYKATGIIDEDRYFKMIENITREISITRKLNEKENYYEIDSDIFKDQDKKIQQEISEKMIQHHLPSIIYFDDFNDTFPNEIEIPDKEEDLNGWSDIINALFKKAESSLITFTETKDENLRASKKSDVENILNKTIAEKWKGFKSLDEKEKISNLTFKIEFYEKNKNSQKNFSYIKIKVCEKVDDKERIFDIKQRSKGFYWFFNFVMKTAFNPKNTKNSNTIFLLDEPGAYLHISVQTELCKKLNELVNEDSNNIVIYCTHSQYLLNLTYIKPPSIKICDKESYGNIKLLSIYEYARLNKSNILALEPIHRVLEVSEDFYGNLKNNIVLVEGITDFYSFKMFNELINKEQDISFIPFTNAKNINYAVPILLGTNKKFLCLYDGDSEGNEAKKELEKIFGTDFNKIAFTLQDLNNDFNKREDLYDRDELLKYKKEKEQSDKPNNNIKKNDIKKITTEIFFNNKNKKSLLSQNFLQTKSNFNTILKILQQKFNNYPL